MLWKQVREMSAVINKSKKIYRMALIVESLFLIMTVFILLFLQIKSVFSFVLGAVSSFIPYCVFVYMTFFRPIKSSQHRLTVFYRSEIIKWITTITLISTVFLFYKDIYLVNFFIAYIFFLLLNNIIPILLFARFR